MSNILLYIVTFPYYVACSRALTCSYKKRTVKTQSAHFYYFNKPILPYTATPTHVKTPGWVTHFFLLKTK
jgi:hypothetical protein